LNNFKKHIVKYAFLFRAIKIIALTPLLIIALTPLINDENAAFAQNPEEHSKKGVELGEKGKLDKSKREFEESNKYYNKESSIAWHNKGYALELQGDYEEAVKCYEEAIRRNPYLAPSFERLGFWKYKFGDYNKAVEFGERTIAIDPENPDVRIWLYDAYRLKMENIGKIVQAEGDYYDSINDLDEPSNDSKQKKPVAPEIRANYYLTFDLGIRLGFSIFSGDKFKYITSQGKITPFPVKLYGFAKPLNWLKIIGTLENPYLGASLPKVVGQSECLEIAYTSLNFYAGLGVLLNHYQNDVVFGKSMSLTDIKPGVVVGFETEGALFTMRLYPRIFPRDGAGSSGYTLDTGYYEMKYLYRSSQIISYYSLMAFQDYYLFDHKAGLSNFYGFAEFGLGVTIENDNMIKYIQTFAFTIEFKKRINLKDVDNNNPYGWFNGQGFLGFSRDKVNGSRFPGIKSKSNIFTPTFREQLNPKVFLYQSFIVEIVDKNEKFHELLIKVGAGYML